MRDKDKSDRDGPGCRSGPFSAIVRSFVVSWVAIALLLAASPSKEPVSFERSETASTFTLLDPVILRRDLATTYLNDLTAKLEWARVSASAKIAKLGGAFALSPPAHLAAVPSGRFATSSSVFRVLATSRICPYNAQAPPEAA